MDELMSGQEDTPWNASEGSQSKDMGQEDFQSMPGSSKDSSSKLAQKAPSLLKAASLIAAVTILSKVLGAFRDWQIVNVYGASLASDAYFAAVQLPSFAIVLLGGLGGPFHTATVAVFSKLLKDTETVSPHANRLASGFLTMTGVLFFLLSLLTFFGAEPIMALILGDSRPELLHSAAEQLKIMSPVIFFGGLIGIFYGLLNIYHSFFWPSLSPAALSVVMSVALFLNPTDETGYVLAWSTLWGTLLQFAMQLPEFFRRRFKLQWVWIWKAPEILQIREMLFPAVVGTTIGQLTTYVDMFFTQYLVLGGWTAIVLGNRLFQLPIGVLQTAFLVPIFPRFTRYVADKEWAQLKDNFKRGIVTLWFISLPILIGILLYVSPLIRIVFEHGKFDAKDTQMVSEALICLSFSMLPYFARDSLTRVFYAFQDSKTPLMIGCIAIGMKAFLDWLLVAYYHFGVGGVTFSTTLITLMNMVLLGILSKKHIQDLGFSALWGPFLKLSLAGAGMMGVMWALDVWVCPYWMPQFHHQCAGLIQETGHNFTDEMLANSIEVLKIIGNTLVGALVYLELALMFKVEEVRYLMARLFPKLKRFHHTPSS